jgi:hypothetical protein
MDLIVTKDGKPFETEQAAKLRKGVLKKSNIVTEVVTVDGGFALKKEPTEKVRIPLHESRRLRFPKREGFHRRVFNDDKKKDRIQKALNAGYTFVTEDVEGRDPRAGDASRIGANTSQHVGDGMTGFLMEIPQELYDEDQRSKQQKIDMQEAAIRRKKEPSGSHDIYGGVKVESGRM